MSESKRILRALCTLAVVCAFARTALADSVLNFTPKGNAGISVTNTTPFVADVKFTLYNTDGTVASSNLTNPFTHRIAPMGQLTKSVSEIFRMKPGTWTGGWIQATSTVNGLQGYYVSGDFATTFSGNTFDGAEASSPFHLQTIPRIVAGTTDVLLTNPGTQTADVIVSFLNSDGKPVGEVPPIELRARAQIALKGVGVTARIEVKAGPAVVATAVTESGTELMLIHGQAPEPRTVRWVVPYFKKGVGLSSRLILANPSLSLSPANVTVTFLDPEGETLHRWESVKIPALGSMEVNDVPEGDGWLRVESSLPLAGVALIDDGSSSTAMPLQSSGSDRILLSRAATQAFTSELTFVGNEDRNATVTVTFNRPDGSTVMHRDFGLLSGQRISIPLADWMPAAGRFDSGFVAIRASAPIYAVGRVRLGYGDGMAQVTPQRLSMSFAAGVPQVTTTKVSLLVDGDPAPGARLKITSEGGTLPADATLWVGDKALPITAGSQGFDATLPSTLDPGPVTARLRIAGIESVSQLGFFAQGFRLQADSPLLRGSALYQKVEVTDNGLDTGLTSLVPIRFARVEVFRSDGTPVVFTETDEMGHFETRIPDERNLSVRVLSRSPLSDLKVLNNTANNTLYSTPARLIDSTADEIEIIENSRSAGAFNILDTIHRGNALLAASVPNFVPPALTIYWSERNNDAVLSRLTNGATRTTFFSLAANAAYVLGDRNTDSDEYDDSVILHEYAHMLAAKFSRDDSNGGTHLPGDLLDPRIAWSEGWANFFSSAARGSSVYRDSKAGNSVFRLDIEDVPTSDRGGYNSEASVHALLWDLMDDNADNGDVAQFPFASIWGAFTDLTLYRNVYLPYFLDRFLLRYPQFSDALRTMALLRSIDFQPDGRPSVTNPFPRTIGINETKQNQQVDSFTSKRTNLAGSAHFYSLTVPTSGPVTIRLFVDGLGPANNPSFNDLDLWVYDSTGRKAIEVADNGRNGDGETITTNLAAGTYFIEVRSFYTRAETNATVFNSGLYRLSVTR